MHQTTFPAALPADYYRAQAERVRVLADAATMPGVKEHLLAVIMEYERLAEEAQSAARNHWRQKVSRRTIGRTRIDAAGASSRFAA
jgi:hypothetical protein